MKYHNGRLRNELDDTLCIRPKVQKVNWKEYVPFVVLAAQACPFQPDSSNVLRCPAGTKCRTMPGWAIPLRECLLQTDRPAISAIDFQRWSCQKVARSFFSSRSIDLFQHMAILPYCVHRDLAKRSSSRFQKRFGSSRWFSLALLPILYGFERNIDAM